jgi:hypothetical protein
MERFLRAELSRGENQEIIRHLLTECPACRAMIREAAQRQGFKVVPLERANDAVSRGARAS